jgi:hypothetical protein
MIAIIRMDGHGKKRKNNKDKRNQEGWVVLSIYKNFDINIFRLSKMNRLIRLVLRNETLPATMGRIAP